VRFSISSANHISHEVSVVNFSVKGCPRFKVISAALTGAAANVSTSPKHTIANHETTASLRMRIPPGYWFVDRCLGHASISYKR
jgi:hypothetical protein